MRASHVLPAAATSAVLAAGVAQATPGVAPWHKPGDMVSPHSGSGISMAGAAG